MVYFFIALIQLVLVGLVNLVVPIDLVFYFVIASQLMLMGFLNNYLMDWRFTKQQIVLQITTVTVFMYICCMLFSSVAGILLVVFISLFNLFYTREWFVSLLYPTVVMIVSVLIDHFIALIDITFLNDMLGTRIVALHSAILYGVILAITSTLIIVTIKRTFNRYFTKIIITKQTVLFIISLSIATLLLYYSNIYIGANEGSDEVIWFNTVFILGYFVVFLVVVGLFMANIAKEIKLKAQQEAYDNLMEYAYSVEDMNSEIKGFKHDYVNVLAALSAYIQLKNMSGLTDYFNNKVMNLGQSFYKTNVVFEKLSNVKLLELKGVLSTKLIRAQSLGVKVHFESDVVETLNIDSITLCRIIGIIMDNAIEECLEVEGGNIDVGLLNRGDSVLIVVKNSSRNKEKRLHELFLSGFSTKGRGRGIGLSNLRKLVDEEPFTRLDTKIGEDIFIQEIEIYKGE